MKKKRKRSPEFLHQLHKMCPGLLPWGREVTVSLTVRELLKFDISLIILFLLLGSMKHPALPPVKRWKAGRGGGGGRGRGAGPNSRLGPGTSGSNVLPSKFLLGGNINDPLNLNSLSDERIARVANAVTPESSPLPTPKHRKPIALYCSAVTIHYHWERELLNIKINVE